MLHKHHEEHFLQSKSLRDLVIGMSDGLTVPFALAAGLSGAVATTNIIVTAGLAEIVAGGIAMGLGGYLGGRSEIDHYASELRREYEEVETIPEEEKNEVRNILLEYGLDSESQDKIVNALAEDKEKWVKFMMRFELGLEAPVEGDEFWSAFWIGGGYLLGGIIPLLPYFFLPTPQTGLIYSAVITLCCLLVFGFVKSKILGQPAVMGAVKVASIGALAALAAFSIAHYVGR